MVVYLAGWAIASGPRYPNPTIGPRAIIMAGQTDLMEPHPVSGSNEEELCGSPNLLLPEANSKLQVLSFVRLYMLRLISGLRPGSTKSWTVIASVRQQR
jgi:hypothetical protein